MSPSSQTPTLTPALVMRPCAYPHCGETVVSGRCPKHASARDSERGNANARGYDMAFRRLRVRCFARDGWACVKCGWVPELVAVCLQVGCALPSPAAILEELRARRNANQQHLHADHILTVEERPDLRLDLGNLQTLCNSCHSKKTRTEQAQSGAKRA